MDIKNAINSLIPIQSKSKPDVSRPLKAESTTDRDGNGQQGYQQPHQERPPMSDEEFKKALEILSSYPAIKEHGLTVESLVVEEKRFVILREPNGQILRRIPEAELWSLPQFNETEGRGRPKGQLLRKTA